MKRNLRIIALTYTPLLNRAVAAMAIAIVCSLLLYGVFLLEAVGATAKRAEAGREIKALTVDLSQMQARYLAYAKEVSPERAEELGFVKPAHVSTIYAAEPSPLSLNGR